MACKFEFRCSTCRVDSSEEDASLKEVVRLCVDQSAITSCSFSPSGLLLAACSDEKKLKVWKAGSWNVLLDRYVFTVLLCMYT